MAFNRTFYFDFRSNNNIKYRLEIYDDVETSIFNQEGTLGSQAVKVKYGSEGSKMFAPLKPSTLTIDMMVTNQTESLYIKKLKEDRQERDVYVGLYRETLNGTATPQYGPVWGGYLLMDLSNDPDEAMPYNIQLKCIDGLASLKYYDFIPDTLDQTPESLYDIEDTYLDNSLSTWRTFTDLISICLGKSGYFTTTQGSPQAPSFTTAVNWYNGEHANTTIDPLANTRAKPSIFYEIETQGNDVIKYKAMNCYDVLVAICKAWGMRCFLWKNRWYFVQINQWETNQTGTQLNPDDIDNYTYTMAGVQSATSDSIQSFWGTYQLFVDNTQAGTNVRNYKMAGGQYGTLPAFKKVTIDFQNVSNINSFTEFPPIPLTSGAGAPTSTGNYYEFTSLGNFTFDGTTTQSFYHRINLALTNNGQESGTFQTQWVLVARPAGTGSNTANTEPYVNGWTKYMHFDLSTMQHVWGNATGLSWATWPCVDTFPIIPGNQTIEITTGAYQFPTFPSSTFTAGDWELGYYVKSSSTGTTASWSGHGRFSPDVYNANKNPWDYNIAYQNVAFGYGIGSSEFAPIISGAIGSYSTLTSLVQTGDDTANEEVKDILFGDTGNNQAGGTIQIYTGSIWKATDISGIWGKNTLAGNNSLSQQLSIDIFAAQSSSLVEFNVSTTLDPTQSIYFNDGTANRPQYICPFTKINTIADNISNTPARQYIMHTGEWSIITDTWKWKLYQQIQNVGSPSSTTSYIGGLNSGLSGGQYDSSPSTNDNSSARRPNPEITSIINNRLLLRQQIDFVASIRVAQQISRTSAEETYQQTITSLAINELERAVFKAGDKIVLQTQSIDNTITASANTKQDRIEFVISTDQTAGATTLSVNSKTIYQDIAEGDTITFNTENLISQYQNKTEGTIAGFTVDSDGIAKSGIEITDWLNSDTMAGASVNNVPTALSVKNYVDGQVGASDTLQEVTDNGNTTTNDIILSNNNVLRSSNSNRFIQIQDGSSQMIFSSYGAHIHKTYDNVSYAERMRLTRFGDLGIGTSSPSDELEVYKNGSDVAIRIHEDAGTHEARLHLRRGGSDWELINNNNFTIEGEGVERFRINTAGLVGIGTSSPATKLHVVSADEIVATIERNSGSGYAVLNIKDGVGTTGNSVIRFSDILASKGQINYEHANDSLSINTAGSERMRITSAGNVGIGTTSPNRLLTLSASGGTYQAFNSTSNNNTTIGSDGVGAFVVYDDTASSYRMVVKASTGNVLIGTTTDSGAKLKVEYAGGSPSGIIVQSTSNRSKIAVADNNTIAYVIAEDSFASYGMQDSLSANNLNINNSGNVLIGTTTDGGQKLQVNGNVVVSGNLMLGSSASGEYITRTGSPYRMGFFTSGTEKMSIANGGNVLIGTTTDSGQKLQVNGTSNLTGTLTGTTATFSGNVGITGTGNLTIRNTTGSGSGIVFMDNIWQAGIEHNSGKINFRTGGQTDRMQIHSSGNVLIGTTTNSGNKLEVNGVASATTFAGDLRGTINTLTTGVTQTANDNSTKIATTAYVDSAEAGSSAYGSFTPAVTQTISSGGNVGVKSTLLFATSQITASNITTAATGLTFATAGLYNISFNFASKVSSTANRTLAAANLEYSTDGETWTEIVGSLVYNYDRGTATSGGASSWGFVYDGSASASFIHSIATSSKIRARFWIEGRASSSSGITTIINGCRLSAHKIA